MNRRAPHGIVWTELLRELGVPKTTVEARARSGRWHRLYPGVLSVVPPHIPVTTVPRMTLDIVEVIPIGQLERRLEQEEVHDALRAVGAPLPLKSRGAGRDAPCDRADPQAAPTADAACRVTEAATPAAPRSG